MSNILTAQNITKSYPLSSGTYPVLKGVSLSLEKGLSYSLIGRSGSGKSTLLHILSGLDTPDSGSVFLNGQNIGDYSDEKKAVFRRRHMGFIFQKFNLLDEYDVKTNICLPLLLDGIRPDSCFLQELTDTLGLTDILHRFPKELSGGEQQRVAIARSLIAKPQIIFADEPTGNLDEQTSKETTELLFLCMRKFGQTLFLATHDLNLARKTDHIFHLENGCIL
ncbi:MAG: ABC transporter ATP-binding protein [Blautia sp.]|nr:ABC transporter ATP-binding protein [Eubacteriales bacterium]MED9966892.1 ABC transporter ATP-binding protein [Blautia sp.]